MEPEDRHCHIVSIDHLGYAKGPKAVEFATLVGRLDEGSKDPSTIAGVCKALKARVLAEGFSVKTLYIDMHGADIMRRVFENGRATILDQLKEHFVDINLNAIPEAVVIKVVTEKLKANISASKHRMSDPGWSKRPVKWSGVDYARQLWVRPNYPVERGKIRVRGEDHPTSGARL
jgi:hypothetical protein